MNAPLLSEERRDALQEIANIGMGRAGDSIARIFDEFVELSVPRILTMSGSEIPHAISTMVGHKDVSVVRQAFHGELRGEVLVVYDHEHRAELAELFGYESNELGESERELLLDVTNALAGACLGGMAEQLRVELGFSAPSLMGERGPVVALFKAERIVVDNALFVEVNFKLERHTFSCHLIILMPDVQINVMEHAIDAFIERF